MNTNKKNAIEKEKNQFCFCLFSSKLKVKFLKKKLKKRMNFIEMMIEKIPKKLLYQTKKKLKIASTKILKI